MARLYLIRHGRPSASWGDDPDASLDPIGRQQAEAVCESLAQAMEPMPIYTSPLRRCRETSLPLERLWQQPAQVLMPVAEIPAPPVDSRGMQQWLERALQGTWPELNKFSPPGSPDYLAWRQTLLDSVLCIPCDSVVFSHFVAINVIVGTAQRLDKVVCFQPDHASVTCVETAGDSIRIVQLGRERDVTVLTPG